LIKKILHLYILFIKEFQLVLSKEYSFDVNEESWSNIRTKIPNASTILEFSYRFHGAGCRVEKEKQVCEFDYAPVDEYPIKFSAWKLLEFINSNGDYAKFNYTEEDIVNKLDMLVEQKILNKLEFGGVVFETYQINQSFYDNPELFINDTRIY